MDNKDQKLMPSMKLRLQLMRKVFHSRNLKDLLKDILDLFEENRVGLDINELLFERLAKGVEPPPKVGLSNELVRHTWVQDQLAKIAP